MTAREEMDLLLRIASQVAQKMLESGGLRHFGTILGSKRDVQVLMPKSVKENVSLEELVSYWRREIGTAAAKAEWRVVACCTFAAELRDDNSFGGSALVIHIEHCDKRTEAEDVAYKYQGSRGSKIILGETSRAGAKRWLMDSATADQFEQRV